MRERHMGWERERDGDQGQIQSPGKGYRHGWEERIRVNVGWANCKSWHQNISSIFLRTVLRLIYFLEWMVLRNDIYSPPNANHSVTPPFSSSQKSETTSYRPGQPLSTNVMPSIQDMFKFLTEEAAAFFRNPPRTSQLNTGRQLSLTADLLFQFQPAFFPGLLIVSPLGNFLLLSLASWWLCIMLL